MSACYTSAMGEKEIMTKWDGQQQGSLEET